MNAQIELVVWFIIFLILWYGLFWFHEHVEYLDKSERLTYTIPLSGVKALVFVLPISMSFILIGI